MTEQEIALNVLGMTCSNCAAGISKALHKAGFHDADADFARGEVSFTIKEGLSAAKAIENIESLGYHVTDTSEGEETGWSNIEKKFAFSLLFTLPLFMHMFAPKDWLINNTVVQIGLCLPVYILGFIHFGRSAYSSLKAKMANMDVLIFMGFNAAFYYSLVGTIAFWGTPAMRDFMFFETTATIITLVLLGNLLEHRSVKQTAQSLGELTKMQSSVARIVMRVNGTEKLFETEPQSVNTGDELQVNEGDNIPVDGKVLSGTAWVNEAAITGESEKMQKTEGSPVFSGTTILSGNFRMVASDKAKDSTLQKIIDLVKKARREQPEIQILGDRVSAVFVPVVLGISLLTFILSAWVFDIGLSASIMHSVAVLVISCPCAMGLATPTAVVVGVGRAAKQGIMIKGGNTLERFANAKTIIFDKTGTLTSGQFEVKIVHNEIGDQAFSIIKSLEQHSSHPIAKAMVKAFDEYPPELLDQISEVKGKGMTAILPTGESVFFGRNSSSQSGDLELRIDHRSVAQISLSDHILSGAADMVSAFKKEGFNVVLLSGDVDAKVQATAKQLGIGEVYSEVSPQGKLDFIEKRSKSETVVMVGDGINDGPALSRAQVGISPGGASALAIDSARVVIMNRREMESLVASFKISKHTYKTIKQNLFWAFFYNVVAIPLAAFGFLNPMLAALTMAFSDVIVIGNSLRLKVKKLK